MQCQGLGEGSLEASPSSGISSVHLFTLHSGNWFFFSSGLTETRENSVETCGRHQSLQP